MVGGVAGVAGVALCSTAAGASNHDGGADDDEGRWDLCDKSLAQNQHQNQHQTSAAAGHVESDHGQHLGQRVSFQSALGLLGLQYSMQDHLD